ncbi:ADP-L-glycero-D-manno-heptose-6-epimerase [Elstera litoralis]|uniref:ADP-L-glycero-D-manno-heptose-6-epimerase n=1 Tax=Elstera litoralis TaxID=552518 RepID=A0A0F3IUQ4_9PROT|nr:ADP-glyceromanno-heptose 6-epimerase [Elstera litoralis]KJV10273.1 ADP-L-glycero-D-manno-heptose-6-epimerase [Elstera litoralis]
MIVVTGGAGFIGSNLLRGLEARGLHDLVVIDRLGQDEKWRNIAKRELAAVVPPEETFAFLDAHAAEIDAIFHLGAVSSTTETDADLINQSNFALTLKLWDWCCWRGARFIYASSAATYGDGAQGFEDDASIAALAQLKPLNAYGWSKHATDRRIARLVAGDGPVPPQWLGLKFFNVYGPNEYHKGGQKSVVAHILPQIQATGRAKLFKSYRPDYADGGQLRDFVWVGDIVDIMLWAYDHPAVSGLFNAGSGQARSFRNLADAVFAAISVRPNIEYIDMPESLRAKYQYFTEARMDRLRAAGYDRPLTPLAEGVKAYVQDYLLQDDPYA